MDINRLFKAGENACGRVMSILPENYIIQKFYEYAGYVQYLKHNNTYNGCCPICHEGKSWGKKKRCFYM